MKKAVSFVVAVCLLTAILLTFSSCAFRNPIDSFVKKIEKKESYQLAMTMSLSDFTVTQIIKCDGNISYTAANDTLGTPATYTEIYDDETYEYTKDSAGKWRKAKKEDTEDDLTEELLELLDGDNYEKVKGEKNKYRQKESVVFEKFEDVRITIDDDAMVIKCEMTLQGETWDLKLVFSKLGEIDLTLPEVGSK